MKKTYKCSNVKFCMEDENQRRTWEYLHGLRRKDGSYGKILSDAFVAYLDGQAADIRENVASQNRIAEDAGIPLDDLKEILESIMDAKLQEFQGVLAEQIGRSLKGYCPDAHPDSGFIKGGMPSDAEEKIQQPEISDDMMAFAFALDG